MNKTWSDFNIAVPPGPGPEIYTTCPQCSASRQKKFAKCLSVNIEKFVWHCNHCDWCGTLKSGEATPGRKVYTRPTWTTIAPGQAIVSWFVARGIPEAIVDAEGITEVLAYMPQLEEEVPCMAFPYRKHGEVVNIKYRAIQDKAFRQVSGAEKVLYRQDCIANDQVIIVEGEIDCLSVIAAGCTSVVSVPDGAPAVNTKNYTAKFTYLDQDPDPFADVQKIIIAVDGDAAGETLRYELGRRLGTDRCWFVQWPDGCKDANDVLRVHGAQALMECLNTAVPFPVQDVINVLDVAASVTDRYYHGVAKGLSTGWPTVDNYYTIQAGQFTVVTGIPGHGKSEWLDALMLNMAENHGWRFAICSPENAPVEQHVEKLLEKTLGAPFRVGPASRMTPTDLDLGLKWLDQYVTFIMPEDALTIQGVLDRATSLVRRLGIRGLIIDPFNEFDHTRMKGVTETEYIGLTLLLLKKWAQKWQVHVWLVAHPAKMHKNLEGEYPVPTPYDINGSANFKNKGDCCVTVWRDENEPDAPVQIYVQKIRHKHIGRIGKAELAWNRLTGRYSEVVNLTD